MSFTHRLVGSFAVILGTGFMAACAVAPADGESVARAGEAATTCAAGYTYVDDAKIVNGKFVGECIQNCVLNGTPCPPPTPDIRTVTGTVPASYLAAYKDSCDFTHIAVPSTIQAGAMTPCSFGALINGQAIFACPIAGTTVASRLGLATSPNVGCSTGPLATQQTCEFVIELSAVATTCLGAPNAGWMFVLDETMPIVSTTLCGGLHQPPCMFPGGCTGGCAATQSPPDGRSGTTVVTKNGT
jgi:hypothetical protein